jgi:hypothetical protein
MPAQPTHVARAPLAPYFSTGSGKDGSGRTDDFHKHVDGLGSLPESTDGRLILQYTSYGEW